MKQFSDRELISLYRQGNEAAFSKLVNNHKDRIYSAIYVFVRDEDAANDLFQETFIKIINTIREGRYNEEGKFLPWALRIAHNLCIDSFRKDKRGPQFANTSAESDNDAFDFIPSDTDNAEEAIIRTQTQEQIRRLIDILPVEQKEVVVLRHFSDLSFAEIAEITGVSINTALGRMRYALINMRKAM